MESAQSDSSPQPETNAARWTSSMDGQISQYDGLQLDRPSCLVLPVISSEYNQEANQERRPGLDATRRLVSSYRTGPLKYLK
jgi:hypothetical protein